MFQRIKLASKKAQIDVEVTVILSVQSALKWFCENQSVDIVSSLLPRRKGKGGFNKKEYTNILYLVHFPKKSIHTTSLTSLKYILVLFSFKERFFIHPVRLDFFSNKMPTAPLTALLRQLRLFVQTSESLSNLKAFSLRSCNSIFNLESETRNAKRKNRENDMKLDGVILALDFSPKTLYVCFAEKSGPFFSFAVLKTN